MNLSPDQQKIPAWVLEHWGERRSCIVNSLAGSGKSTTAARVIEAVYERYPEALAAYLAFGKRNVKDMVRKQANLTLPSDISDRFRVCTQHSLGLSVMRGQRLNLRRTDEIVDRLDIVKGNWKFALSRLASAAQNAGVLVPDENGRTFYPSVEDWAKLALDNDIDSMMPVKKPTYATWKMIAGWMEKILPEHAKITGTVTFGDQVWLPLVNPQLRKQIPIFDLIIIDEFQDTNVVRRIFANACAGEKSLRLWVGDLNQSIMGFSGADTKAFFSVQGSQNCPVDTLALNETFRLTHSSATWASKLVPEMRAHVAAPPGRPPQVQHFPEIAPQPGDGILARTNRAVVDLFFRFMSRGVRVRIESLEFADTMTKLHDRLTKREITRGMNLTEFRGYVAGDGAAKITEYVNEGRKWKAMKVSDEYRSYLRIIDFALQAPEAVMMSTLGAGASPFGPPPDYSTRNLHTISEVITYLGNSSTDDDSSRESMITVSTIHKAKGLEWNNVYWYAFDTLHPSKFAITVEEQKQDRNLEYVARTRSRGDNYLVPCINEIPELEVSGEEEE